MKQPAAQSGDEPCNTGLIS